MKIQFEVFGQNGQAYQIEMSPSDEPGDIAPMMQAADLALQYLTRAGYQIRAVGQSHAGRPTFCGYICSGIADGPDGLPTWVLDDQGRQAGIHRKQGDAWYSVKVVADDTGEVSYEPIGLRIAAGNIAPAIVWPGETAIEPSRSDNVVPEQPSLAGPMRPETRAAFEHMADRAVQNGDGGPLSEPARVPVAADPPQGERCSSVQQQRIGRLGATVYGEDDWAEGMGESWAKCASGGNAAKARDLTPKQADQVIEALCFVQVARRFYGKEEANDKIRQILDKAAEADGAAAYRAPCEMPQATSRRLIAKLVEMEKKQASA